MRWLLSIDPALSDADLERLLRDMGIDPSDVLATTPVGDDKVVDVEGPRDLPHRAKTQPEVRAVHPSSEMTPN